MAFSDSKIQNGQFKVYCVFGGLGFPHGTASTKRISLMGQCLVSKGIPFHVLHIGPNSFKENTVKSGEHNGLSFEYLSPLIQRPSGKLKRVFCYLWGSLLLPIRLFERRKNIIVYVYYQGDFFNLWTLFLCRLFDIPAVQEVCEWWPGTAHSKPYHGWIYRNIMFRWSKGALPISREIQDRIRSFAGDEFPQCRVPVLVDPEAQKDLQTEDTTSSSVPVLFWCGMVDGYKRDVRFLIEAMGKMKSPQGEKALLRIAGPCSEACKEELLSYAAANNISESRIEIAGFISDSQLWSYCFRADALLMPLWDDDRSTTRFPTKFGQYLVAGRPIVTAPIGEIKHFLTEETAVLYPAGDVKGLTQSLDWLLSNRFSGEALSLEATQTVLPEVDYRENASRVSDWFARIYSGAHHG